MILVDANLLIYADAAQTPVAIAPLDAARLSKSGAFGISTGDPIAVPLRHRW